MKKKKFDVNKVQYEYITTDKSYRELAEEYGVDQSTISKYGKSLNWVYYRKHFRATVNQKALEEAERREVEKLSRLETITDKAIDIVDNFIGEFENAKKNKAKYGNFKDCVSSLDKLANLKYMLNGRLTPKEEASLSIAREKLQLERERIGFDEGEDKETGIVEIPMIVPNPKENIVIEGETNA
ncbi:MAG: hypothetical protein IJ731_06170 [Eubacterium sp.]|nr:hypothetical protein [Eubacterium sp.]